MAPENRERSPDSPITRSTDSLLVVGCGNPLASDDSVGLEVVRRLRAGGVDGAEFVEFTGSDLDLLELFDKAQVVLLVDAVHSGAPPGTLHLLPLPSTALMTRGASRVSSHGWNLDAVLRLAYSLGRKIRRLMLLGIELQSVTPGDSRTPAVEAAIESVITRFPQIKAAALEGDSVSYTNWK